MKSKASKAPQAAVKAEDFNWGTIFTGSKPALVKAGLMPQNYRIPKLGHEGDSYRLPLDWSERYRHAIFGETRTGIVPSNWEASVVNNDGQKALQVFVRFNAEHDLNIRERAEHALIALRAAIKLVEDIAPRPLSVTIPEAIKGRK
jgi:hypothetical protein